MPRVTLDICDVCYHDDKKQKETPASDTLRFSWLGTAYVIYACAQHVDGVRDTLQHYADIASQAEDQPSVLPVATRQRATRGPAAATPTTERTVTLFSQLDSEEKDRFRTWANMPTARRIGDSRVQEWIDAGKP